MLETWIVHRRCNGVIVKRTLGPFDALTVEDARHAARVLIAGAAAGDRAALSVPTVQAFAPAFLADCAERWKPATRKSYAFNVGRWILPAFGERRVDAVGAKDVRGWFDGIAATHPGYVELGAGGDVVADAARRDALAAARGLQPVPGTAATQDRLPGALPDRR